LALGSWKAVVGNWHLAVDQTNAKATVNLGGLGYFELSPLDLGMRGRDTRSGDLVIGRSGVRMTSLTRKSRESQQIDLGSREVVAEQISHPLAALGDSR
jgi:hypothetical protein